MSTHICRKWVTDFFSLYRLKNFQLFIFSFASELFDFFTRIINITAQCKTTPFNNGFIKSRQIHFIYIVLRKLTCITGNTNLNLNKNIVCFFYL